MKSKLAITLASAILLIAALFLALPPQQVSAQTCRDARGNVIPCPEKRKTKTPLPPAPTSTPSATPTKPASVFGFGGVPPIPTDKRPPKIETPWGDLPTFGGVLGPLLLGGLLLLLLILGMIISRGVPKTGGVIEKVPNLNFSSDDHKPFHHGDDGGFDTGPQLQLDEGSKLQPPAEPHGGVHEHLEELGSSKPLLPADEQLDLGGSDTGPQPQSGEDPSPPPEPGDRDP